MNFLGQSWKSRPSLLALGPLLGESTGAVPAEVTWNGRPLVSSSYPSFLNFFEELRGMGQWAAPAHATGS